MSENQSKNQLEITETDPLEDSQNEKSAGIEDLDIPPEVVEAIKESGLSKEQQSEIIEAVSVSMGFSGPIPHPQILAGYEKIVPGAGDRILRMAENEAKHRHSVDDRCIRADSRDGLLGIIAAFVIGMTCVVGGIIVILKVPEGMGAVAGFLLAGSGLAGIIGSFIRGTKATWKMNHEPRSSDKKK